MPAEHRNVSLSRRHFDRLAGEYDTSFTRQMPTYGEMHETVLAMAALGGREPERVLELGAGTGTLTKKLLERFPRAEVTAVDLSAEMLALARTKLAFAGERVNLREADVSSADLGAGYDAVVSAIAFHHVPPRKKPVVIAAAHRALKEGGALVIGDTFKAASPQLREGLRLLNEERLRAGGGVRRGHGGAQGPLRAFGRELGTGARLRALVHAGGVRLRRLRVEADESCRRLWREAGLAAHLDDAEGLTGLHAVGLPRLVRALLHVLGKLGGALGGESGSRASAAPRS